MSRRQSWKIWVPIIAILLLSGLMTALWPLITGSLAAGASQAAPAAEQFVFHLPLVIPGLGVDIIVLNSVQMMAIMAGIVIGLVLAFGIPIAIIIWFLSRQTTRAYADEEVQQEMANLAQLEKERLARKNAGREVSGPGGEQRVSRWDAVATSIIVVLFVVCVGILVDAALFPREPVIEAHQVVNTTLYLIGIPALLAVLILAWRIRPTKLEAFESAGETTQGIPWDFIFVLIAGLLIVGLGLGFMVYLRATSPL